MCACTLLAMTLFAGGGPDKSKETGARKSRAAAAGAAPAQPLDEGYTKKIREYTTEPFFSTELVDHLPASATVPTPEKVLGYAIGAPNKLTYTKDIHRYYRALAAASPRVKVFSVGKSEEGREFLLVAVSEKENIAQLDRYKQITAKLADPRKISDAEAQQLIQEGKPIYWASGSIHSPETGSPEMLMELAYRLAVEDTPFIQNIRKKVILLITPVLEVDGRDREVDVYNYHLANPDKPPMRLIFWGHYVAHDNNRDAIAMGLELSKAQMKNFLEWHPQVLHDLHESEPFLYISTGTGPYNAWLDPIVVSEWQSMAYNEIEQFTARGVPGVWTHDYYDGWAPNYMFYVANGHNSIGRFYETFGNGGADTRVRTVPAGQTTRAWFRPNPPLPKIKWSLRDNTNYEESGLLFALDYTAAHASEFINNFYLKSKRSVAKATTEGPAAWVLVEDGRRPALTAQLAELLQAQGAEVHRLDKDFEVKETAPTPGGAAGRRGAPDRMGQGGGGRPAGAEGEAGGAPRPPAPTAVKIPAGSYVARMDQPYSRVVDMLLDTQYFNVSDPRPYDDTGWTLGPLRNVKTLRVTDSAILKAPMTLLAGPARATGGVSGAADAKFFLINANAEPALATLRFRLKDVPMFAAEEAFDADGAKYNIGSFIIPVEGAPSDLRPRLDQSAADLGVRVQAASSDIKVARHPLAAPRIALMHTWQSTQNDGWFRMALDSIAVPYDYISDQTVRATPNLREKYDAIIFPPSSPSISALINGTPKRLLADGSDFGGPIPWKRTELTPNVGTIDETDDIRGGLGFEGVDNLRKFIEEGGLFVPITTSAALPVETGITSGVSVVEARQLQARGAIFNAHVEDKHSPIAYGYDDTVGVYFNQAPIFRVSLLGGGGGFGGGGFFGGGGGGGRASGRGSATDPDIPQGRPWSPPAPEPRRSRAEQELYIDPEVREFMRGMIPPEEMWPRVVLRFAEERNLWVSGMLAGATELAETPAVVDVAVGRGHVVFFANNPMWRQETHGSFMLLLNAALNFDHLQAGHKPPAAERPRSEAGGDDADE
jgi:uncharacterized membrane protein YgcG